MKKQSKIVTELLRKYRRLGFIVPPGSKFWCYTTLDGKKEWGLQTGAYTHTCHIDTTDYIVLLIIKDYNVYVKDFDDIDLSKCITI